MNRSLSVCGISILSCLLSYPLAAGPAAAPSPRPQNPARGAAQPPAPQRAQRGEPLAPCPKGLGSLLRETRAEGFTVDSCGRRIDGAGVEIPALGGRGKSVLPPLTVDRMTTRLFTQHAAGGPLSLLGSADRYDLNDGSHWPSGAGSYYEKTAALDHLEVSGSTLRFVLSPPTDGSIYEQTDYDFGDHSAQGTLGISGPLVLEAQAGSSTAVLRGNALVLANDATWYGEPRFNFYSSVVGSVVPFELTITLQGDVWTPDVFNRAFTASSAGWVDFAHPVSTPHAVALSIAGPSRLPDERTTRFTATVLYENEVRRGASFLSSWSVDPPTFASIDHGTLTIGTVPGDTDLTLHATFVQGSDSLAATKTVRIVADLAAEKPGTWPMFQANARHTGTLATALEPTTLRLKWQRNLGEGLALNPVAAGDGKVFATLQIYFNDTPTLFALRASDGATLWSKGFGSVFSVNPPSYAYGNVYLQTGNHSTDTWLRAYDGATGEAMFQAPHQAQWERYFAPTIYDGKAYVDGGTYGGMYAFDAFDGEPLWYVGLPQYDEWTPAVDASSAHAYVGEYDPGLYVQDRATGSASSFVPDLAFDWNGWSMGLAPVLGEHQDVIAIHDGRLISFDTAAHTIRWQLASQFAGQPSVSQGRIYALDGGRLRVLDELTHAEIWSWEAPEGGLAGPMIVTDRHLFVSSEQKVYAVDLAAKQAVWSYPVAGQLAIADKMLYVASPDGRLSAFDSPPGTAFYTLTPCRVVDTRLTGGVPVGGPALSGGIARTLPIAGNCSVPPAATAIAANVTVTDPGAAGYLQLDATGSSPLPFSTVNYSAGQTRANLAILSLGPSGELVAVAQQNPGSTVQLIVDVTGYFVPVSTP